MKILALLACLAVVYARYSGPETAFEPNKEYSFKYESQILTGIRDAGKYVSAFKVEAQCKLQIRPNFQVYARFEDVRLFRLVDELPEEVHPYETLPSDRLVPLESREIAEQLTKPFRFTYTQGKVSDLECESDELYYSVNIKRGFLNILEMKLEKPQELEYEQQENREVVEAYQRNDVRTTSDEDVFAIKEHGIEGKCKTIYTILETPEGYKKVYKVKDLEKCENRPTYMLGVLSNLKPKTCGTEKSVLNILTDAEYEVKGTPRSFLISKALYKSQHMVAPMDVNSGVIASYTVQKLELKQVTDSISIQEPISLVRKNTFKLEMPLPLRLQEQHSSHMSQVQAKKQQVTDLLNRIIRESMPEVSIDAVYMVTTVIDILKELPAETIKEIIIESEYKKKELLIDLIHADDTPKTAKLIKQLLIEDIIGETRAIYLLNNYLSVAQPSEDILDVLIPFCKTDYRCSKPLKTIVLLGIGSVTNKIYKQRDILPEQMYRSAIEKCETELKRLYESASEVHEKIVVIKAMANAGIPAFLPKLEQIIMRENERPVVRKQAIYGLKNYTLIAPEKVQKICMPIYLDVTNPIEIRIPCFVVIMETKPSLPLMTIITKSLNREPSIEVGSFVFTHMSTLATKECMLDTYKKAKIALMLAKPVIPKYAGSASVRFENFVDVWKYGNFLELSSVRYENTQLPNELFAKFGSIWNKFVIDILEGGVELRGLKPLEEMLIGREQGIIWQVLKNRMTPREAIDRIIRWVREGEYENAPEERKVISMYCKVFATQIFHIDLERVDINTIIDYVQQQVSYYLPRLMQGVEVDVLRPLMALRWGYMIPSPIGLPLSVNLTATSLAGVHGNLRIQEFNANNVHIIKNLKPSVATSVILSIGVHLPEVTVGHGLRAISKVNLPCKSETEIDLNQLTVVLNADVPQREYDVLRAEIVPVAFMKRIPVMSEQDIIVKEDLVRPELCEPRTIRKEFSEVFGLGFDIELKTMKQINKNLNLLPTFHGKQSVKITLRRGYTRPEKIELKAALLCPTCPMTDSQKHEFLFGSNYRQQQRDIQTVDEENSWGSWWGRSSRREQRLSSDVSFDEVQPDTSMVNPRLNYKLAFVCKTKQATEQKIIGAQVCVMMNNELKKYQIDTQLITPFPFSQQLKKIKLITKISLPEYLFRSNAWIREGEKTLVHKTEVYIGECHNPTKQCVIETKLSKLPYQWRDIPVELTPVKLETKVSEMRRLPKPVVTLVKKAVVALKTSYWAVLNNYINVYDLLEYTLQPIDPERITLEARIFPTELKAEYRIKMEEMYTKIEVCPYKLPWSVPVKPITYENLPSTYEHQQQQREEDRELDDNEYEPCERKLLTKKLRRTTEDEVCFSIEPVYTCKGACRRPEQYDRQQVEFTCMPRSSARAQRLISESLQRPLYDLRYERRDLVHEVPIPQYCEAY